MRTPSLISRQMQGALTRQTPLDSPFAPGDSLVGIQRNDSGPPQLVYWKLQRNRASRNSIIDVIGDQRFGIDEELTCSRP